MHFLVVIDHCSRFVVTNVVSAPTAEAAIRLLKIHWIPVFGTPTVILCDRGPSFISSEFRNFVTQYVSAHLVFTSAYYPQGNGINEACHQSLKRGISVACIESADDFETILADVTMVHNSIPTTTNGHSPFFILFGLEPTFPGWQCLKQEISEDSRTITRSEARHRLILKSELVARDVELTDVPQFKVGQWVVFYLSDYEKTKTTGKEGITSFKYSPSWSLPCRVIEVKDKVLIVAEMGLLGYHRQVPITQVKALKEKIPEPLAELNLKLLEVAAPLFMRRPARWLSATPEASRQLADLIDDSFRSRKRARIATPAST